MSKHDLVFRLLLVAFKLIFILGLNAQDLWISDLSSPLSSVSRQLLPKLDNDRLYELNKKSEQFNAPNTFAFARDMQIDVVQEGSWEVLSTGKYLLRWQVTSPTAYSLNLTFNAFHLPPSAKLFLYDLKKSNVIGPIANKDNKDHGKWWSPIVPGENLIVEIQVDEKDVPELRLKVEKVNHDFAGLGYVLSQSCNLDVICSEENGFKLVDRYRDVINSVGMYTLNGIRQCSGVLLNNTRNDCTPYFLTANHCEVSQSNAASIIVYWNFQNSTCRAPSSAQSGGVGDGNLNQFNSGASLIASYNVTDFSLLLLDKEVDPQYQPFFAGWDASGEVFDSTFCVHHPNSDEKRISFDYDSVQVYADQFFARIHDWDIGSTEGGSSGAPLFNKNKRVIGQLNGGQASCDNQEFDDFGMFKLSWNGGETPQTALKFWLDPDNSGKLSLDGRSCTNVISLSKSKIDICTLNSRKDTIRVTVKSGYDNGAKLSLRNVPSGITAVLEKPNLKLGESTQIFVEILNSYVGPMSIFNIAIDDSLGVSLLEVIVFANTSLPSQPVLIEPVNDAEHLNFDIQFRWSADAAKSEIVISTNVDFIGSSYLTQIITGKEFKQSGFVSNSIYYWKVRALNNCGFGPFSTVNSFSTGNIQCFKYGSSDLPKNIKGDDQDTIVSKIFVNDDAIIADVNILNVTGSHSWVSDLSFAVKSPSGKRVNLLVNPCEDENNFFVSFDDESNLINVDCPVNNQLPYRPLQSLSAFDGERSKGEWQLIIIDNAALDGGRFDSWTLELCLNLENSRLISLKEPNVRLCPKTNSHSNFTVKLSGGFSDPIKFDLRTKDMSVVNSIVTKDSATSYRVQISDLSKILNHDTIVVFVSDSIGVERLSIPLKLVDPPPSSSLQSPGNKSERIELKPLFEWTSSGVDSFRFELATDSLFTEIIVRSKLATKSFEPENDLKERTNYYWRVHSLGTCSNSSSLTYRFTTDMKVSVNNELLSQIEIYPNPVKDLINIRVSRPFLRKNSRFTLYNISGNVVMTGIEMNELTIINVSHLTEGVYLLSLNLDGKILNSKLVLLR